MQYINGHAPQIGDIIEVPSTRQRLTVTSIPRAEIVVCGTQQLYANGCALLSRGSGMQGGNVEGMRPDNFGSYGGGYGGAGYVDPGLSLVEDLFVAEAVMDIAADVFDIAADIAIMDDFGGGFF